MNSPSPADAETIASAIRDLKQGSPPSSCVPGLLVWHDQIIGRLRPLRRADVEDDGLLTLLLTWRNRHRTAFYTQFEATLASTRNWLSTLVLDRPDRIMFLITDEINRPVGHCGVCNVCPDSAELDAVMRGERLGHSMLMVLAERALLKWVFDVLRVGRVHAHIFEDNISSIRLFLSVGLTISHREMFRMVMEGGVARYVPMGNTASEDGRKVAHLELLRSAFAAGAAD